MKIIHFITMFLIFNITSSFALNIVHVKHTTSKEFLGIYHYDNLSDLNSYQLALRYSYINRPLYALTSNQKSISNVLVTNNQILSLAFKTQLFSKIQSEFITHMVSAKMGKDNVNSFSDSEVIMLFPFINQDDWILNLAAKLILPTGQSSNFTTGKSIGFGGSFNFENRNENYLAILNIGLTFQNKNQYQIVDLSNLLEFSLGYIQTVYKKWKFGFEVNRATTFATDQGQNAGENLLILSHPSDKDGVFQIGLGVEGFSNLELKKRIGTVKITHSF